MGALHVNKDKSYTVCHAYISILHCRETKRHLHLFNFFFFFYFNNLSIPECVRDETRYTTPRSLFRWFKCNLDRLTFDLQGNIGVKANL